LVQNEELILDGMKNWLEGRNILQIIQSIIAIPKN
jgi:hypothetical protein